jgi:hypothetical protein
MKKQLLFLLTILIIATLQSCSSSSPTPSSNDFIKGNWKEVKTTTTGKITKGLPLAASFLLPNGVIPAGVLDTIKIIREMTFINDKDVDILVAANQPVVKSNWKFTNGTSGMEFSNFKFNNPLLSSVTTLNATITKLTATEFVFSTVTKLTDAEFDASGFGVPGIGRLKVDLEVTSIIEMKK